MMPAEINVDALTLPYYDGAGNDFFIYDARIQPADPDFLELARYVCDRQGPFGGADGLLVLDPAATAQADFRMRIFNADGSEPEMCGNGARCAVRYLLEDGGDRITLETLAGFVHGEIVQRTAPFTVRIAIGEPKFTAAEIGIDPQQVQAEDEVNDAQLPIDGTVWTFDAISFGNPHIVIFTGDVEQIDVAKLGPKLECAPLFLYGTNVHFVQVLDHESLRVRHWERGAGATAACGTGAAAAAVAAIRRGYVSSPVRIYVPGGELGVRWQAGHAAELSGPTTRHAVNGDA